ncbi:hypothetical protein Bca101_066374 [Brassica carinata]
MDVLLRMRPFVGMGTTLLDGVVVEKHGLVAAGVLLTQNTRIPSGELRNEEIDFFFPEVSDNYSNLAKAHAAENAKPLNAIEFEKGLRKRYAQKDEEYDSMLGIVRETPRNLN